jgi:hypothetical protein
MRVEAHWSKQVSDPKLRRFDSENQPIQQDTGWVVALRADGSYLVELFAGSTAGVADHSAQGEISREEAGVVGLRLRKTEADPWLAHDAPEMIAFLETQRG